MEQNMKQSLPTDNGISDYQNVSASENASDAQSTIDRRKQQVRRSLKMYCLSSLLTIAIACLCSLLLETYLLFWAGLFLVACGALMQGILAFLHVKGFLEEKPKEPK